MHLLVNALTLLPERSNNKPAESISLLPVATDPSSICSAINSSVVRSKSNSSPVESIGVEDSFGYEQLLIKSDPTPNAQAQAALVEFVKKTRLLILYSLN